MYTHTLVTLQGENDMNSDNVTSGLCVFAFLGLEPSAMPDKSCAWILYF